MTSASFFRIIFLGNAHKWLNPIGDRFLSYAESFGEISLIDFP